MATDSNLLAEIAEDFTERLRSSDAPTVEEYIRRHPDLADEIRRLLPSIQAMEQLGVQESTERRFERKTRRLTLEPDGQLGDFRILREIGRGGMGVVYEAEQQSLKRRVALKILGPTMANSEKQLRRFQIEAQAIGRLHHTNIVSVFGVGEHDGLHYYAMQLIDGLTISEAIALKDSGEEFITRDGPLSKSWFLSSGNQSIAGTVVAAERATVPDPSGDVQAQSGISWTDPTANPKPEPKHQSEINEQLHAPSRWHEIARIGECVASALHYAHSNGVLHRDIKPSNLLMDRDGAVWVTDFGLAHHEDLNAVTASGDIVGTLRYMAPEQFHGTFDARCDIYSLGLTIYEMLVFRPAFTENRHGPLIHQKTTSAPAKPRTLNPEIPRDLETIVLKACAVDPATRYQNAGELAADLRRFREDRPIHARRTSVPEKFWRWARRNPSTAWLIMLSLLLLTTLLALTTVSNRRQRTSLRELRVAKQRLFLNNLVSQGQAHNLRSVSGEGQRTLLKVLSILEAERLPESIDLELERRGEPAASVVMLPREELLIPVLEYFLKYADYEQTESLQEDAARAWAHAGDTQVLLGRYEDALASYRHGRSAFRILAESVSPADGLSGTSAERIRAEFTTQRARLQYRIAGVRSRLGMPPDDEQETIGTALKLLQNLDHAGLNYSEGRFEYVLAVHQSHLVFLRERSATRFVAAPQRHDDLAERFEENGRAISVLQELIADSSHSAEYQQASIRLQTDRGRLALLKGDNAAAVLHLRAAASLLEERLLLLRKTGADQPGSNVLFRPMCELAYVLCIAPEPLTGRVQSDLARECLRALIGSMQRLQAAAGAFEHARVVAARAEERLRAIPSRGQSVP